MATVPYSALNVNSADASQLEGGTTTMIHWLASAHPVVCGQEPNQSTAMPAPSS